MSQIQLNAEEIIQEMTRQNGEEVARLKQQLAVAIVEVRTLYRYIEQIKAEPVSEEISMEPVGTGSKGG